ncbi:MAG: hypothetical protein AB7F86_11620 [Bdellovibrionales bacterium]
MLIKVKKDWKDLSDSGPKHKATSRRDFLMKGLATGAVGVLLPESIAGRFGNQAFAQAMDCPAPVRNIGAIAQIFAEGGPTMGARFISDAQAAVMNAGMARNYGITGQANLVRLGPNMVVDRTSPFGFTLMQGPPGYPGGATAWQNNVLKKISGGAHLGPFNQDDGAGENTGLLGGVSPFKVSQMGKDLKINNSKTVASWSRGLPATSVAGRNLAPNSFSSAFSLTPAANGLTNSNAMTLASDAANGIARALASIFKNGERKGGEQMMKAAGCGFYGNSALADPNYGASLFNPANIQALAGVATVGQLSTAEQALLASFYQSAAGVAGGVIIEYRGRDYHDQSPQNNITPADVEEARAIVMFLAACEAAGAPGAMIYLSNGQAIANGTTATTATINGATANLNCPVASGDAGGAYNAGMIIFFDPKGSPPAARFTGTVNSTSGNARIDPAVGSSPEAVAGLYLSALSWVGGGSIPASAQAAVKSAGLNGNALVI